MPCHDKPKTKSQIAREYAEKHGIPVVELPLAKISEPEKIVAAAVQYRGITLSLQPPARHHTILQTMDILVGISQDELHSSNQGFLTSEGRYVNRVEAFYIAYKANQLMKELAAKKASIKPELYSEDLW